MSCIVLVGCKSETPSPERCQDSTQSGSSRSEPQRVQRVSLARGRALRIEADASGNLLSVTEEVDNRAQGATVSWHQGVVVGISRANGVALHGALHNFYESGALLAETWYRDGKSHGPERHWYETGEVLRVGNNEHGIPVGEWNEYFVTGEVKQRTTYRVRGNDVVATPWNLERRCSPHDPLVPVYAEGKPVDGKPVPPPDCPSTKLP